MRNSGVRIQGAGVREALSGFAAINEFVRLGEAAQGPLAPES